MKSMRIRKVREELSEMKRTWNVTTTCKIDVSCRVRDAVVYLYESGLSSSKHSKKKVAFLLQSFEISSKAPIEEEKMVKAKPFFGMIETAENGESLNSIPRTMIEQNKQSFDTCSCFHLYI